MITKKGLCLGLFLILQACLPPPTKTVEGKRKSENVSATKETSVSVGSTTSPDKGQGSDAAASDSTNLPNISVLPSAGDSEMPQVGSQDKEPILEEESPPLDKAAYLRFRVAEGKDLAYVSNRDISKAAQKIETVILIVHGIDRNPMVYYNSILASVKAQGASLDKTWIIAPYFMQEEDKPLANDLRWEDGNWKEGLSAKGLSGVNLSSYTALDKLIKALDKPDRFSSLKKIYVVGFSAGGQYMQRYTLGTKISDEMKNHQFRFVIGAPGSYMYVTGDRLKTGSKTVFDKSAVSACPDYDDFRYGINKRPDYLMQSTQADMLARLKYRDIRYVAGEADTSRGGVLDVTCGADLEGSNRYTRSQNYFAYVKSLANDHHSKVFSVPGAAHEHDKVFSSSQGRAAIFSD